MGKRKESSTTGTEDDPLSVTESPGSAHKKHKKHKKKHKKKRDSEESYSDFSVFETFGTKDILPACEESNEPFINVTDENLDDQEGQEPQEVLKVEVEQEAQEGQEDKETPKVPHKTESDEEEQWLDALEKGELDDYGEIQKKAKDPSLLTARQRALLHGKQEHELLQLPSGYKTAELTEEQVVKRQQRAKKRRQQAHEKREKDKKQILDRLLKKQETKTKGPKMKGAKRANIPRVRYLNSRAGIAISMPVGHVFPLVPQKAEPPKSPNLCGVSGCKNVKKYNCSKTSVPLCSLKCYKKNLDLSKACDVAVT
ncbi:hypothetical protein ScPMuIL_006119 [Solemya velum]